MTRHPSRRPLLLCWSGLTMALLACDPMGAGHPDRTSATAPGTETEAAGTAARRAPLIPSHPDALPADSDAAVLNLDELSAESSADGQAAPRDAVAKAERINTAQTDEAPPTVTLPTNSETPEDPEVKRLVIARAVADREPEPLQEGRTSEPVTAFVELANKSDIDSAIVVTFEHESGEKVGFIELAVPSDSARYRTWGRTKNIKRPGKWTAVVSSKAGKELAREEFDVLAAE